MSATAIAAVAITALGVALVLARQLPGVTADRVDRIADGALAALAVTGIAVAAFLFADHITFPLALEIMEGTVVQHFRRAFAFEPIYTEPTPEFVALAYNPLYYFVAIPFGWMFGPGLFALRLLSILATAGCAALLFDTVRRRTSSVWWGLVCAGLFAAAYRTMDAYLDTAHADATFLFSTLLGCAVLDRSRSRAGELLGLLLLIGAFWLKQHGALFAIGGVLALTLRHGVRGALPYWITAIALGPIAYVFAGPALFGSHFHYFTWEVPRSWSDPSLEMISRLALLIGRGYPVLALAAIWAFVSRLLPAIQRHRTQPGAPFEIDIWTVQLPVAALSGAMGALDHGSSQNVFIPLGTWLILMGTLGLADMAARRGSLPKPITRLRPAHLALFVSFAALVFDPRPLITSPHAQATYADLVAELEGLDGPVYMPFIGQLPSDYTLYPGAHLVAVEDMVRGQDVAGVYETRLRSPLTPAIQPGGPAYLITNSPLTPGFHTLRVLMPVYSEMRDYRDRFRPLAAIRHRWDLYWPRFLYRFDSSKGS